MKIWVVALVVAVVAITAGVVFRGALRNTLFATVNRRKATIDRTGNRTNDIPSRRGELPVDLRDDKSTSPVGDR